MTHPAILTCALTGVLTDPKQHPVPVTPAQMAAEARDAFDARVGQALGVANREVLDATIAVVHQTLVLRSCMQCLFERVERDVDTRQPTIIRAKTSITKAT